MKSSLELQKQVKENAEDLRNFVSDLKNWENEMKKKEADTHRSSSSSSVDVPISPIRNSCKKRESSEQSKPNQSHTTKKRVCDYAAWEKFDVDKACEDVDMETEEEKTLRENLSRDQANYEKEKGNQFVKQAKWTEAIECYNKAIKLHSRDAIFYANRALCFLKKKNFRAAETDCTSALAIDENYVKALHRRATARKELGFVQEAVDDLVRALRLEPDNTALLSDKEKLVRDLYYVHSQAMRTHEEMVEELTAAKEPIVPATKHTPEGKVSSGRNETESAPPASVQSSFVITSSNLKNSKLPHVESVIWPEIANTAQTEIVRSWDKPVHLRSKAPLTRIRVTEISDSKCAISTKKTDSQESSNNQTSSESLLEQLPKSIPEAPKNSVQFLAAWRQFNNDTKYCYKYLKQIDGNKLPEIFQDSLDGNILSQLISVLVLEFIPAQDSVLDFLKGLTNVRRFRTITLFMSAADRKNLNALLVHCKSVDSCSEETVSSLRKDFEL